MIDAALLAPKGDCNETNKHRAFNAGHPARIGRVRDDRHGHLHVRYSELRRSRYRNSVGIPGATESDSLIRRPHLQFLHCHGKSGRPPPPRHRHCNRFGRSCDSLRRG